MDIIGRLKNLEVLKLKNFAFYGPGWEVADDTLRLIEIDSCYPSLVKSAKKIQEEQRELGFVILELRLGCHTTKTLKKRMKAVNKEMRRTACSQGMYMHQFNLLVEEELKFVEVLQWQTIPREAASPLGSERANFFLILS
nr:putative late blight resistance protein homolog R1A-3 isoform X2 [Ipomoea trifida]